jgi:DNA polymerase-3 subunit epsilon
MNGWLRRASAKDSPGASRWVVVDVEATSIDARSATLLAIAGIGVAVVDQGPPAILLGDSFEVVLRHADPVVDKSNILIHGIGVRAQREGAEPGAALAAFERWAAGAPLVAFHSAFDERMLARAMRAALGRTLENPWLDLEHVAEAVRPDVRARTLDDWLHLYAIECAVRHQAAADTLATAELLLRLWARIVASGEGTTFAALRRLAAQRKWLRRQ